MSSSESLTVDTVRRAAESLGLDLTAEEAAALTELGGLYITAYDRVRQLAGSLGEPTREVESRAPEPSSNRNNGWVVRCEIGGSPTGSLAGKRLAVKDNICVAGVPMLVGSPLMEDVRPATDAIVVERALAAGATIVGKTAVPGFCFDGASITGYPEPQPVNPWKDGYCPGGSSGGNAIVLVNDEADIAIGTDTAGSIRLPASWSGCCGFKPTFGVVPASGIFPIERTLDHVGPMGQTVRDCALLMDAIAGPEAGALDAAAAPTEAYSEDIDAGVAGLRIGLLTEAFAIPGVSEPDVDDAVRRAARHLEARGARILDVSVPLHADAVAIWAAILFEGATDQFFSGDGLGSNRRGRYPADVAAVFGSRRRDRGDELPPTVKLTAIVGRHMTETSCHALYGTAQNLALVLQAAYATALDDVDVLMMPTTPMKATPIPASSDTTETVHVAWSNLQNTAPFNVSGHPALSVPCSFSGGLPIGAMIVGRHYADATVLRVGRALETRSDD